jgi:peptidoglycan lytic transglycosylase
MVTSYRRILLTIAIAVMVTGCGKKVKTAKTPKVGSSETGIASWYGYPYHGRRAANGEIYDMEKLTAAHRTYPFDTWVRVKNLSNDRTVDVRIQDRGPFVKGRVIDLSHAAAREIDLLGVGVTKVRLTVIAPPKHVVEVAAKTVETPSKTSERPSKTIEAPATAPVKELELFAVQVGAFKDRNRAVKLSEEMRQRFGSSRIVERAANPPIYRVLAGEFSTEEEAEDAATQIRSAGGSALAVRIDDVD